MQSCLGATYAWSVFVGPLRAWWNLGQGEAVVPFTVFYIVFPAMAVPAGRLLSRWPLRRCAVLGGLLFGGGWLLASLGSYHFAFTVAGIGVVAGMGAGLAYLVPLQACILWFPRRKALVSGLVVAGFGGGAALVAAVSSGLMSAGAMSPFEVFRIFGLLYLVLIPAAGMTMARPSVSAAAAHRPLSLRNVFSQPLFWILYVAMTAGLMAGFAVNANLKDLVTGEHAAAGVRAVALFAVGNAAGRIGWGWLHDRTPGGSLLALNLLFQSGIVAGIAWLLPDRPGALPWLALASGAAYGGVLVLYASAVAGVWGSEHVGRVYGCLFSSNIVAAAAASVAGVLYDRTGSFAAPLLILTVLLSAAAIMVLRLFPRAADRAASVQLPPAIEAPSL